MAANTAIITTMSTATTTTTAMTTWMGGGGIDNCNCNNGSSHSDRCCRCNYKPPCIVATSYICLVLIYFNQNFFFLLSKFNGLNLYWTWTKPAKLSSLSSGLQFSLLPPYRSSSGSRFSKVSWRTRLNQTWATLVMVTIELFLHMDSKSKWHYKYLKTKHQYLIFNISTYINVQLLTLSSYTSYLPTYGSYLIKTSRVVQVLMKPILSLRKSLHTSSQSCSHIIEDFQFLLNSSLTTQT